MRLILFTFLIFCSLNSHAQPANLSGKSNSEISQYYINYLRKGVLLVRLQTKSRKIAILERAGNLAAADKVRNDQIKTNKSIIKAFKDGFSFCPVYFFYSHDSKHVKSYQLDSVDFLNEYLEIDGSIQPPNQFLTAEFGLIQEDTAQNFEGYSRDYKKDSIKGLYPNKQYASGTNMSFGALIIKSDQFIQLPRPFPYYARNLATLPILRRSHYKVVTVMNNKLFAFARL
ncbi:MAG: hypothetical protein AB8B74_06190 [Crocinitomicaceae bacterium]